MTLHPISGKSYLLPLLVLCASLCAAQTAVPVVLAPVPQLQFFDQSGRPLAFGCVFTYQSQTTTPLATFSDFSGQFQNQNPVPLNAGGSANIWLQSGQAYTLTVKSSGGDRCALGQTLYTVDGVGGGASQLNTVVTPSGGSAAFTVQSQNQLFSITLTGNVAGSPVSFIGVIAPALVTFQITEDGAGAHTFTWPSNVIGAISVATCANCVTTQTFVWNGTTIMPVAPSYNLNGQNYPPDRADTLTGQYETINGGAGGAIVGYSFWGRHDSPSSTSSEVLITHKISGTMPALGTQAALTVENDIVGAVTPSTVAVISQEAYTAIRSTGGTFPDVRGMTSSVNLDLVSSTSNVTTASDYFAAQISNISSTATIANAYGFNGQAQIKGTARNYAGYFTQGAGGTNFGAMLLGYNSGAAIDAEDSVGTPHRLLYEDTSANTILQAIGTNGLFLKDSTGATQVKVTSSAIVFSSDATFSAGVTADGGGFKHKRFGATCTTTNSIGNSCTTTFSWTTAFADANYTPVCSPTGPANGPVFSIDSFSASGVTVRVYTFVALASGYSGVDCVGVHD